MFMPIRSEKERDILIMVDMKAKPFYLSEEDCKWVEETIAGMTTEEKIGQLFFNMGSSRDEEYLKMTVDKYHIGGIRYNPATGAEVREQNRILQENSKIPLIIACNTENGGNGACTDGTMIGQQTKIGALRQETSDTRTSSAVCPTKRRRRSGVISPLPRSATSSTTGRTRSSDCAPMETMWAACAR